MRAQLTPKAIAEIETGFDLNRKAWRLLDLIVAEWESDPISVQCFDLRIVEEAKSIVRRRKEIDKYDWSPMFNDTGKAGGE